jgi:GH43 family beta-xylosidase
VRYTNPVYAGYLADPFVWRHDGTYYAVGTGAPEAKAAVAEVLDRAARAGVDTRLFPMLRSDDLVTWRDIGGALVPPKDAYGDLPYAPEVAHADAKFFLYYSIGRMNQVRQLRVAVADRPEGPYVDEARLTDPFTMYFANDPHPFRDVDGTWYLFYSRDFVDNADGFRVGGGIVVDRLVDMTTLAGEERLVARPRFDWQRFDAHRVRYGDEWDWHLLEGPAVVERDGRYYCFYSGGNWESCDYGVDYVVADSVTGPWSDTGSDDGPRVLRAVPKLAPGPGHNSFVTGPDGVTTYVVYHCWDPGLRDRRMCIDPLVWTDDGPRCDGPSTDECG